ncbi:MAG: hypothetical protein EOP23_12510 [Hyphomicrobiales bacterium]|nr:MAG: hypothetical protein EOP23_12510 [Hyphomicrobiales bacterium]
MPRYRFTTDDGKNVDRGDDTLEFVNDSAAADAAQEALADMVHDALPNGSSLDLSAEVERAGGDEVYHASLKFRGETAEQAHTKPAKMDAQADEAVDPVTKALKADPKMP